jgi:hypothetical protein
MKWMIKRQLGASRIARGLVTRTLQPVAPPTLVDDAVLLTSELVSNVISHTTDDCRLHVSFDRKGAGFSVLVGVTDSTPWVVADAVTGRPKRVAHSGLGLVDILATDWGCDVGIDTKTVWFQLDVPPGGPDGAIRMTD